MQQNEAHKLGENVVLTFDDVEWAGMMTFSTDTDVKSTISIRTFFFWEAAK